MIRQKIFLVLFAGLMGIAMVSCNFPGPLPAPTQFPILNTSPTASTSTPEATSPAETMLPVSTPVVVTAIPSNTPVSTETLEPSATSTSLPPTATKKPTHRPTKTSTAIPSVTAQAAHLSKSPSIDGPWDEWTTTQYPIKHVVYGGANWTGSDDLQASYRVGWDSNYLYLAVKVTDDVYVQNATGANLYKGDSIEVLLSTDPDDDSSSQGLASFDYQIGISPGKPYIGKNKEAYLWFPQNKARSLDNVSIGSVPMTGGYRIEFAIPWSVFKITPYKGQLLGFAVSVSDNDNEDKNVQQTLISSAPDRHLTDPTTWGLLVLK
jgi:hypothetical protein